MSPVPEPPSRFLERAAMPALLVGITLAFGWILLPFFGAVLWGAIIALLFSPLNQWLLTRLRGARNVAALLTIMVVLVIVVIPFAAVTASLAHEAALVYDRVQTGSLNPALYFRGVYSALPDWVMALFQRFGLADFEVLQRRVGTGLAQASQYLATQAVNVGQNTFEWLASLVITLYLAFFLVRDGPAVARAVRRAIPLAPAHKQELIEKFATVIRATVKGNLLVAAIQGVLGGIAFWFLGVGAALLWAVLMGFLSLLPAVGAGLVWVPVAAYFLMSGEIWQGVSLAAYGVLVIGLVDNLLRPLLVGKDTRMPDYVVMITTLGGMAVFGINGFIIGPAIGAMFFAVWHIHAEHGAPTRTGK